METRMSTHTTAQLALQEKVLRCLGEEQQVREQLDVAGGKMMMGATAGGALLLFGGWDVVYKSSPSSRSGL